MSDNSNESAISEIIGVILVVALTVIMAAIIASYAFGLMGGVPRSYMIMVTVDQPETTVPYMYVTYRGGPDHTSLVSLTITWPDGTREDWLGPKVGDNRPVRNIGSGPMNVTPEKKDHVVIVGHFMNNIDHVVLDTWV